MNIAVLGERNIETFGEYDTVFFEGRNYTNVELLDLARKFSAALTGIGVAPGDRVGVMLPNIPEIGACYGGISRMGGVVMPMVFLLAVPEIRHILADSGAAAVITSPEFYPNVLEATKELDRAPQVIILGDPVPEGTLSFQTLVDQAQPDAGIVDRGEDDIAVIFYTSGTTGRPKGVMLSHSNLMFNAENTSKVVPTRDGRYLWVSSRGDGTVKRIDLTGQSALFSLPVGVQPESVMLAAPDDRTLIVSLRGGPATLAFVDTVGLEVDSSVQIGGVGTFGDLAVISRNGRFVYATFDGTAAGQGGVAVVDVDSRRVVATWEYPGGGRPHGIWHSSLKPHVNEQ